MNFQPANSSRLTLTTLSACSLVLFVFTPVYSKKANPSVKSATTKQSSTVPVLDSTQFPAITAKSVTLFDPVSQTTIYEKDSHQEMHPASLTKIMTAIIALEHYELDQTMKVRSASNSMGSSVKLQAGIDMTVESLLSAALISSGNDAAVTLAENYPGGYSKFIDAMNEKARSLGMFSTHFTNVAGMEDPLHKTTAFDLSLLSGYAMNNVNFARFVNTQKAVIADISGSVSYGLFNTNLLLDQNDVIGIKTGTSPNAGQNLILCFNHLSHTVIITILNSTDRFDDGTKIINYLKSHLDWNEV